MMKFVVNQLPYYGELCPLWTMCSKNAKIPQIEKLTFYVRAEVKPWLLFFV